MELMGKKQAGEISPQEMIELNKLINEDPANAELLNLVEKIWDMPLDREQQVTEAYVKERWNKARERWASNDQQPVALRTTHLRLTKIIRYAAVAACFILLAGAGAWWLVTHRAKGDSLVHNNVITTKNGSHSRINLPDGTEVWLNAGSNLTYNELFGKETRDVQLVGEAFFDVTKDAAHPFIIHTKTMNIKVLGTAFNVRAYPDEKTTEAALLRGSIEISLTARPSDRIFLKPNEKIAVRNDEPQLFKNSDTATVKEKEENTAAPAIAVSKLTYDGADSTVVEAAWVKNKLIFRNKPFEELTKEMERWYNVSIIIKNRSLIQRRFTGIFYNESAQEALDKLKVTYPFRYQFNKSSNTITIE